MMRLPRLRNRWRITLWILVTVAAVTLVAGVASIRVVESRFTERIDDEARSELSGVITAIDVFGFEALEQFADVRQVGETDRALLVVSATGVDLALPSGQAQSPDPLPDLSSRTFAQLRAQAGEPFEVDSVEGAPRYRVVTDQLRDGRVAVSATSLAGRDDAITTLIGTLTVAAIAVVIVLAVVISIVSAYITRPLDAMIATAERIGTGGLDARVPPGGVEDVDRLARALNAMLDRLEQAFADSASSEEKLRRFVADASHELRTPLSAVLGYTELYAAHMASSPEAVDQAMARIAAEGERMRLLVEELLMLARLDHNRPAEMVDVDLGPLVASAVCDAQVIAPDRPIAYEPPARPVRVVADATSIRQAVDNLLANTRSHTPSGTSVTVSVTVDAASARIAVADSGPGIDPEDLPKVFDRFYRAERSRARPGGAGGSGLGLAIVAAIAESHGGSATVQSRPGEGATFTLNLPLTPATAPTPAPASASVSR